MLSAAIGLGRLQIGVREFPNVLLLHCFANPLPSVVDAQGFFRCV